MRKAIISLFVLIAGMTAVSAQAPDWVRQHPVSEKEYIGVGSASLDDPDHFRKATQEALADIASQIAIKVESTSFLHQVDVDGHAREMFEDRINGSMTAWLEGQELAGSYSGEDKYYVCYTLDKKLYAEKAAQKRESVLSAGLDYLQKGRESENSMDLTQAVHLYAKGLETVEPWLFMDLTAFSGGRQVNVPVELYNALLGVFSGMAITVNTLQISGEMYKPVPEPIAGCLSKNGDVVPNIKLKAYFETGSGVITPPAATDYTGTAEFYITNITSKEQVQEIRITVDDSVWSDLPGAYSYMVGRQNIPSAKITLVLESGPVSAYLHVGDNDLEGCEKYIGSLLANNYFSLTEDPDAAQCFVDLSSVIDMGETVSGGTYDLNVCYCSLSLKIYDNSTEELLLDYSVNNVKVLAPVHKSAEATIAMCVREVMKRVNRELPAKLGKVKVM